MYTTGRFIGSQRMEKAIAQRSETGIDAQALWISEEFRQLVAKRVCASRNRRHSGQGDCYGVYRQQRRHARAASGICADAAAPRNRRRLSASRRKSMPHYRSGAESTAIIRAIISSGIAARWWSLICRRLWRFITIITRTICCCATFFRFAPRSSGTGSRHADKLLRRYRLCPKPRLVSGVLQLHFFPISAADNSIREPRAF